MNRNETIKEILKQSTSTILVTSAIILIYLGLVGKAAMPAAFYAGMSLLGFSVIYYIGELTLKIKKVNRIAKTLKEKSIYG